MRYIITTIALLSFSLVQAQGPDEYWIGLEEHAVHTEGDLAGMTTWRMYLNMLHPDDFLSACSGSEENPWILESTSTPAWYNHPTVSETFATAINPLFFDAFPELEYDSWLSLGVENSEEDMAITSVADPAYNAFNAFENGENVQSNTMIGNLWFTLFPELGADNEAFAGEDLKVLIGQITTEGSLSGTIYVQIFPEGIQNPDVRLLLPILYAPIQCTDTEACNFDPVAWLDTACEYGPEAGTIEGQFEIVMQTPDADQQTYTCDAGADSYVWDTGNGAEILSGQGTNTIVVNWNTGNSDYTTITVTAYNENDCPGNGSSLEIQFAYSIDDLDITSNLSAYPNPANSSVSIRFESSITFGTIPCDMRSITGQLVKQFNIVVGVATIDVSDLANGTYILNLQTERGLVRETLVVSH
jgi:hypothetical protein